MDYEIIYETAINDIPKLQDFLNKEIGKETIIS